MTEAQEDTLEKIQAMLREHFDCAVLAVAFDVTDDTNEFPEVIWHGGYLPCLALSYKAHQHIDEASERDDDEY